MVEKKKLFYALFIPLIICVLSLMSFVLEVGMGWNFKFAGILPLNIWHSWGILSYVFVHSSWMHLINNSISFLILGTLLYYFYGEIANQVLVLSYLISGVLLWFIGRESYHIGMSAVIYALSSFLVFSGFFRRHTPLMGVTLIVVFIYGNMIWHIFPWEKNDPISWEGHLSGGVTGLLLSVFFLKKGPRKPKVEWEDSDDEFDFNYDDMNQELGVDKKK